MNNELTKISTMLSQRRVWSAIFGALAMLLTIVGYTEFDPNTATNATMQIVDAVNQIITALSSLASIGLALHSWFFPKKDQTQSNG